MKLFSKRNLALIAVLALAASTISIISIIMPKPKLTNSKITLAKECKGKTNDFDCQKKFYKSTYENGGLKVAFDSLKTESNTNISVKSNCHQLTHVIGRAAGDKYRDVSKAYTDGDTFCWSGYYHGVMEAILERYGDNVRTNLSSVCSGVANEGKYLFKHYNCAHGLGHGVMLIEGNELFDSLATCDNLSDNWERESCYGGVYMENIMAEANPDHDTKYLKNDDPMYPCTAVGGKYKEQCYMMQTSHALTLVNRDFNKVFELCGGSEEAYRATCWQSLGRDAAGNSNNTVSATHDTCMLGKSVQARENCVIGAVKDFVSNYHGIKEATELCQSFESPLSDLCHKTRQEYYTLF